MTPEATATDAAGIAQVAGAKSANRGRSAILARSSGRSAARSDTRRLTAAAQIAAADPGAGLERVVLERLDDAGLRDLRDPRGRPVPADIGHDDLPGRHRAQQRLEAHADQRRQVAARQLSARPESRGTRPAASRRAPSPPRPRSARTARCSGSIVAALRYAASAPAKSCRCSSSSPICTSETASRGIELRRAPEMVERGLRRSHPAARAGRARDTGTRCRARPSSARSYPARASSRRPAAAAAARLGDHVLQVAEAQDVDAPREIGRASCRRPAPLRRPRAPRRRARGRAASGRVRPAPARTAAPRASAASNALTARSWSWRASAT